MATLKWATDLQPARQTCCDCNQPAAIRSVRTWPVSIKTLQKVTQRREPTGTMARRAPEQPVQAATTTTTTNINQNMAALRQQAEAHLVRAPRSLSRRYVLKQMDALAMRAEDEDCAASQPRRRRQEREG